MSASQPRLGKDGKILESARHVRARKRADAVSIREALVLKMYASGSTWLEIENALRMEFGMGYRGAGRALLRSGLARRAEQDSQTAAEARQLYLAEIRVLKEAVFPVALGTKTDDDGNTGAPDMRAVDMAIKLMDREAVVTGAIAPPKAGDQHLHLHLPENVDAARQRIMEGLGREREKHSLVDGQLAGVDGQHMIEGSAVVLDETRLPPPPVARESAREPAHPPGPARP